MEQVVVKRAEWTTEYVNSLPDSSFAYVEPGGSKDAVGRTVPRGLRHLPYKDADGEVDLPHLRAALSRVSQTDLPKATQARVRLRLDAAAAKHGVGKHAKGMDLDGNGQPRVGSDAVVFGPGGADGWPQKSAESNQKKGIDEEYEKFLDQVHSAVKAAAGPGSEVQTLVFGKDKYPKAADAKAWAGDHGFQSGDVDETGESFRLRQKDPGAFVRMRTITLTEGVQAVVGFPKKTVVAVKDAFLAQVGPSVKAADLDGATFEPVEESEAGTVYAVKFAGRTSYFAEAGGSAAPVPMYEAMRKSVYVPIRKSSEERRYTLGVVYPASKAGKPEPDFHGDVMSDDEIRKSAWGFMGKGTDRVGLMHRPGTSGSGRVVESYTWPEDAPEWKVKDIGGQDQSVSPGDWMMGVVWEPEAWESVKSGNIKGYSLQGAARKIAVEDV